MTVHFKVFLRKQGRKQLIWLLKGFEVIHICV